MIQPDFRPTEQPSVSTVLDLVRRHVDSVLECFLDSCAVNAPDSCLPPLVDVVREFHAGGKRLRPLFCCTGFAAAGGDPRNEVVVSVSSALELFHSFALIHDDVMDGSDLRRGRPTVHRRLGVRMPGPRSSPADPRVDEAFGVNVAILLGDACMMWSDELLYGSGISPVRWAAVRPLLQTMRNELIVGQYLDLASENDGDALDQAWRIIRHKTAAYTVARPLQIGAALGGADRTLLDELAEFGFPLGEAFQLRDDLLGVFGDAAATGKSTFDDLRAGKPTVLMALTWRHATEAQRSVIRRLHGDPELDEDGAARLRDLITETGSPDMVRTAIENRAAQALRVVDRMPVTAQVRRTLAELTDMTTQRRR